MANGFWFADSQQVSQLTKIVSFRRGLCGGKSRCSAFDCVELEMSIIYSKRDGSGTKWLGNLKNGTDTDIIVFFHLQCLEILIAFFLC